MTDSVPPQPPEPLNLDDLLVQHERYTDSDECMACDLGLLAASECRVPQLVATVRAESAARDRAEQQLTDLREYTKELEQRFEDVDRRLSECLESL